MLVASFQDPAEDGGDPLIRAGTAVAAAAARPGSPADAEALADAVVELRSVAGELPLPRYPDAYVAHYELRAIWKLIDWGAASEAHELVREALERDFEAADMNRWLSRVALTGIAADLARQNGLREEAQQRLEQWRALLATAESVDVPRPDVLWERFTCLSFEIALALDRGMPDEAMRSMPELVGLQRQIAADPRDETDGPKSWYYVQRTHLLALLALDRLSDASEHFDAIAGTQEFEALDDVLRLGLRQCDALARAALIIRDGDVAPDTASPFSAILADPSFESLSHAERAEAYLVEAAFQLERGGLDAAREPYTRWRELEAQWGSQAQAYHIAVRGWALRARMLALDDGPADESARAELAAVREGFRELLRRAQELTRDAPTAVLHYGEIRGVIVELCLAGQRLVGREAAEWLIDDLEAVEALGSVAHRLGARADEKWRDWFADDGSGGIVYVPAAQRSLAALLSSADVHVVELPGGARIERARAELDDAVRHFVRAEGRRGGPELAAARARMQDLLLPESIRSVVAAWNRLVVVNPELMGHVPFELLEAKPGRPIGLDAVVEYWPSLAVHRALAERPATEDARSLALCVRTASVPAGLATSRAFELPRRALDTWRDRIAAEDIALALERDATVDWLATTAPDSAMVWIVAHGVLDHDRGSASGLAIPSADGSHPYLAADDARWSPSDDGAGLRMPRAVVLGACGAWRAAFRRGNDGAGHLPTRFLEAGANAVILPYHDVRFSDHQAFAAAFLDAVADGAPDMGEALRRARIALVEAASDPLAAIAPLLVHLDGRAATPVPIRTVVADIGASWSRGWARWLMLGVVASACASLLLRHAMRTRRAA